MTEMLIELDIWLKTSPVTVIIKQLCAWQQSLERLGKTIPLRKVSCLLIHRVMGKAVLDSVV